MIENNTTLVRAKKHEKGFTAKSLAYPLSHIPYPLSHIPYPLSLIPYPISLIPYPLLLISFLFFLNLLANESIYRKVALYIPDDRVITTEFTGNYAQQFASELRTYLRTQKKVQFVDYDEQRKVVETQSKYDEPVFDGKHSGMPSLTSPDISIRGSARLQKSNILFKQKEHLDIQVIVADLITGETLFDLNERLVAKTNPPILLLVILIVLVLAIARWIIFLKRGYNVMNILIGAMFLVTLIVVWWLL